jgi:hypothetical protein
MMESPLTLRSDERVAGRRGSIFLILKDIIDCSLKEISLIAP